jgi:hypothetical protein
MLRRHVLDWLNAELAVWSKLLDTANAGQRGAIAQTLQPWKQDTDLAGIRDTQELAKFSDEERAGFQQLWNGIKELLTKVAKAH